MHSPRKSNPRGSATGPVTPAKGPGLRNGMRARLDSLKSTTLSTPAVPKQQQIQNAGGTIDRSNANEAHPIPKAKKIVQASAAMATTQPQKPSGHPIPIQQMPFHQPQHHVQFGGSNPQIQSPAMANSPLQMPLQLPLPMGNPPQVQQQVFVQHYPMQSQGIIHQGKSLNFSSQMGPPQMPPQMGNMGIGLGPNYPQQQTGKFGGPLKTVKITHPDTHEELRLDKRSHPHGPPQSQAIPSFPPAHPMNYHSGSYNTNPLFYPPPNSNPMTSAQITSGSQAAPRFYNQVTVKPAASAQRDHETVKGKGNNAAKAKKKKKKKEILKNADAQGSTSDLYMAYKVPEEKKETLLAEITESSSDVIGKQTCVESDEESGSSKFVPDDWEDAADISAPKLEISENSEEGNDGMTKKYSRDFLQKFSEQRIDLPEGFKVISDIAKALILVSYVDISPMPVMYKAERKYEEQVKQRVLKGILNELAPQNFEQLFEQVKQVNIDNAQTLSGVIGLFDKVLMEPMFCEMYANFCSRLAVELPDFTEDDEKITFKRLLLNNCQEEFERRERAQEEANRTKEEGDVKQSEEEREEERVQARRRMLGYIRLIGELYKEKMLTENIMHECIKKLLGQYQNPDEEDIEALCQLMSTIGKRIDRAKAKEHMDVYFDLMLKLSNNMKLSSRVRSMLKDAIDLRKNKWQKRRKVKGPKKMRGGPNGYDPSLSFDRVLPSSPPAREAVSMPSQNVSSDKVWPEERLRDMSMEAIKEYYSARDENEIALCIKDLNAPSFYPSMISIWVTDSFKRKDMERDSLSKLLVNLTRSQGGILTQDSLLKGFESVLSALEDAVNDAPRAAEFLGRIFAGILMENVIPYKEVWRLIYEGGEEQGCLVEIGLAAEVLGVILEIIKSEKGDPFLNEIRTASNLRIENFLPPNIQKSLRLDKFI